jgi:hypothetical protein
LEEKETSLAVRQVQEYEAQEWTPPKEKQVEQKRTSRPANPLVSTKDLNAYANQQNRDRPMTESERKDFMALYNKLQPDQLQGMLKILSDT